MKNETQIKCPSCGTSIDVQDILSHQLEDEIKKKYQAEIGITKKRYEAEQEKLLREKQEFENKKKQENELFRERFDKKLREDYNVRESVPSERFAKLNLVQLQPETGRRHQFRKHLSQIGNPILGDKDYSIENLILNGKGLYLHAYSLEFIHPFTKEAVLRKDEFPQRFKKIFVQI